MEVPGRVPPRRRIATSHVPAFQALPEVYPGCALDEALLAAFHRRRLGFRPRFRALEMLAGTRRRRRGVQLARYRGLLLLEPVEQGFFDVQCLEYPSQDFVVRRSGVTGRQQPL